jgi:hypothetical protein
MSDKPTRRSFFGHAGAALATPLATTVAFVGQRDGAGYVFGRLDTIEDLNAIRVLQQRYARLVGAGRGEALAALFADPALASVGEPVCNVVIDGDDAIELSSDGTATARVPCVVTTVTPIADDGTFAEMARLQGDGVIKRTEKRVLSSALVKLDGTWKLERVEWLV